MSSHFITVCLDCGAQSPFLPGAPACPKCGSLWREAIYDYENLAFTLPVVLPGRPFDIWRYRELLPIRDPNPDYSLGEGGTPLIHAKNLGMMLGLHNLYIKDERQGPTTSFKDRQAALMMSSLKEAGINELVCASTGNVAISYSAYAARAGIKLWAFLTSLVPAAKMREVALYGTQVVKITGTYDEAKQLAAQFAKQRNLFLDLGARSIPCLESMKTIAFEITEQLTALCLHAGMTNTKLLLLSDPTATGPGLDRHRDIRSVLGDLLVPEPPHREQLSRLVGSRHHRDAAGSRQPAGPGLVAEKRERLRAPGGALLQPRWRSFDHFSGP